MLNINELIHELKFSDENFFYMLMINDHQFTLITENIYHDINPLMVGVGWRLCRDMIEMCVDENYEIDELYLDVFYGIEEYFNTVT